MRPQQKPSGIARAHERARRRRKRRTRHTSHSRPPSKTRPELLSEALIVASAHQRQRVSWGFVAAIGLHVLVLGVAVSAPVFWPESPPSPAVVRTFFDAAPPPPPLQRRGSPIVLRRDVDTPAQPQPDRLEPDARTTFREDEPLVPLEIPEEILAPDIDVQYGFEDGFDLGELEGMEGGVEGGVVGGVLGGIVGGVIGGTGTEVYPQPDVPPQPIRTPRPSYTVEAIRQKITGEVVLQVVIDTQGRVEVLRVLQSIPGLDEEAIQVVENEWRFRPAMKNNRPVPALAELAVAFNLF